MEDRNVILTGFMGTGKTAVGRMLAARLDYAWVDTDALIELQHGPIPQIFAAQGEETFRRFEGEIARELAVRKGLVISTGGRLMLDPLNASLLGATGRVFCLAASPDAIVERIQDAENERPLLAETDQAERIRFLLGERASGYRQFEQVPTDGLAAEEVTEEIVRRLQRPQANS